MPESVPMVAGLTQAEIEQRVSRVVARAMDRDPSEVTPETSLEANLGAESLDYLDIAFGLEREFKIQFPRADFMQRAADHFGEENLVKDGVVTDFGLSLLAKGMPELDPARLKPGMRVTEVRRMFTVATFVRVVTRLLEAKEQMNRTCTACGGTLVESPSGAEFVCETCKATVPLPGGDDVLFNDLLKLLE